MHFYLLIRSSFEICPAFLTRFRNMKFFVPFSLLCVFLPYFGAFFVESAIFLYFKRFLLAFLPFAMYTFIQKTSA